MAGVLIGLILDSLVPASSFTLIEDPVPSASVATRFGSIETLVIPLPCASVSPSMGGSGLRYLGAKSPERLDLALRQASQKFL